MDNYSVCLDFLPAISDDNPDASFMRESIDRLCTANEEVINEGVREMIDAAIKKIKSKAISKRFNNSKPDAKYKPADHIGKKSASAPKKTSRTPVFGEGAEKERKTESGDYIKGLNIIYETIESNLDAYIEISKIIRGAYASIKKPEDADRAMSELLEKSKEAIAAWNSACAKRNAKYKLSGDANIMDYAASLTDSNALKDITSDDLGVLEGLKKRCAKLAMKLNEFYMFSAFDDSPTIKAYIEARKVIGNEADMKLNMSLLHSVINDCAETVDDMQSMNALLNAAIDKAKAGDETVNEAVNPRSVYYRLGESNVYQFSRNLETVDGAKLESNITRMVRDGQGFTFVGMDDLDRSVIYELFESNQYFNVGVSGCKRGMRNMIGTGKVQMVYSDHYVVDVSVPFVITTGANARVFVNISHFVSVSDSGKYVVTQLRNRNGLMAALFAACVAYSIVSHYHRLNSDIGDPLVLMYSYMLTDVFDRMVHMDSVMRDKVRYLCAEFALTQLYGTSIGQETFHRIKKKYFPKLSPMLMNSIDSQFNVDCFDDLNSFIDAMVTNYPSMRKITFKDVWTVWYKRYGASSIMALDYLGYMIYILSELLYESPLINRLTLDPMLKAARGELALKTLQTMIATAG